MSTKKASKEFEADDTGEVVPVAPLRTVEAWAEEKGMLPQLVSVNGRTRANPEFWRFAAARALCNWPVGKELTEADFDAAITAAGNQQLR